MWSCQWAGLLRWHSGQVVASLLACAYRIHARRSALLSGVSGDMEARPRLIHSHGKHCSQISDGQYVGQKLSLLYTLCLHCSCGPITQLHCFPIPPPPPPPPHTHTPLRAFYSWIVLNCIPFSVNGDYTQYLPRQLCTLALSVYCMHAKKVA